MGPVGAERGGNLLGCCRARAYWHGLDITAMLLMTVYVLYVQRLSLVLTFPSLMSRSFSKHRFTGGAFGLALSLC